MKLGFPKNGLANKYRQRFGGEKKSFPRPIMVAILANPSVG